MLLVPSQYTLQAEIEVMTGLDIGGSFQIDVLSPTRLQSRVFERAGQPDRVVFDERGKCMVLSEIIAQERDNLIVYRSAAQQGSLGLAQKASALIADMKRSGITAQELANALEKMEEDSQARRKLDDIAHLFACYEQRMGKQLADGEDVARIMRKKMKRSGVMEGQHVFVYGFDMITPTFAVDLMHMNTLCKSLTLAVETDRNSAPDGRLFAPVNASIDRLLSLAKEEKIVVEIERIDAELDAPDEIRKLEAGLFALGRHVCADKPERIELRAASTKRMEVHIAASRMRKLCAEGVDPADMAVIYPKGSGYAPLLQNILPMYGLPAYIAEKRAAGNNPLCRFVLSSLAVISGGWRTADVLECIKAGFFGFTREEIDALCSYAQGIDLRSDAWKSPFTYIKNGSQEDLKQLETSRQKISAPLMAFGKALSSAETADDTVTAVIDLLRDVAALDTLEEMRGQLKDAGFESEAEDCAQVWNQLMETLDQLHTLLGERSVGADVVTELLTSGLAALELSALPPAEGAVICGEIGNVRTAQVGALFALGMNDMGGETDSGLLAPQETEEAVRATGAYLGMSAAERAALSQLDELKALSGCRGRLFVSYALADETGRALREGSCVQALRGLYPKLEVLGGLAQEEMDEMLIAPLSAAQALSVQLSDAVDGRQPLTDAAQQAYTALSRNEQGREALLAITRRLGEAARDRLDGSQARALYGRPVMSVSRLEMFAQCPYRHFVRYGLAPEQEIKPGVDRAELGTLYHEAAERFTRAVTALPEFPQVAPEVCDRLMDAAVQPLIEEWRGSPLGKSARGASIAGRIEKTARRAGRNIVSQFAGSRFTPMKSELIFGQNGLAPIMLELSDGSFVYLQGRIDRIDVLDGDRIRIVDYKSGTKKFDPTMAYWGLQLQLLLYLAAALAQIPGSRAAGFFYCRIADPTIRSESRVKEEIEKQIAKKLSLAGVSISDVEILRAQGESHAAMLTKDGKPSGRYAGAMVDEEGMDGLVAFAKRKAAQLAADAYAGVIEDSPAEHGQFVACQTCDYAAVCGFDPTRQQRRRLSDKRIEDLR